MRVYSFQFLAISKWKAILIFPNSIVMASPRADYVSNFTSNRHQRINQARQAYLGSSSRNHKIEPILTYNSLDKAQQIERTSRFNSPPASQTHRKPKRSRTKIKTTGMNAVKDKIVQGTPKMASSRKAISINKDKQQERLRRENQLGDNCRIVILRNGKPSHQYFTRVHETNQIRALISQRQGEHFVTVPRQISLELSMTVSNIPGKFLNGQSIYFKPWPALPLLDSGPSLSSFELIRPIGSGGFSQVLLGRSKIDNCFYALKLIEKDMVSRNSKENLVMNELNVMAGCNHPFVVDLKYAFESEKYLVFVMEYCGAGELFGLIKRYGRLSQATSKFYIIEILLGLEHLHSQNVVYRDIKPENILLGIDGHAKIADLGLAKPNMHKGDLSHSFCGSPEYMSPEMIRQAGHSFPVDYYCVGALLYELLTGLPPFYSRDPNEIYEAVLSQKVSFPQQIHFTEQCRSLLRSLLEKDPKHRLGSICGIRQILAHPWFGKQNYKLFVAKKVEPPIFFKSVKHMSLFLDTQLSEVQRKDLQKFKKEQKNDKHNSKPFLQGFCYPSRQTAKSESKGQQDKAHQMKIPFLSTRVRTLGKQNRFKMKAGTMMNSQSLRSSAAHLPLRTQR